VHETVSLFFTFLKARMESLKSSEIYKERRRDIE